MALSYFFVDSLAAEIVQLNEDTSKHMIGVLRMQKGAEVLLTDGKGQKAKAVIADDNRKRCAVAIQSIETEAERQPHITLAVSMTKNASRFEWFLEKATEIGINAIIPLLCERTEKEKFRYDRMKGILVSALLQSQQTWLPVLHEPTDFGSAVKVATQEKKFIAHCLQETKVQLAEARLPLTTNQSSALILIGPEGDFTTNEISLALENNFVPVALGETRLRTETAGIVAGTLLRMLPAVS